MTKQRRSFSAEFKRGLPIGRLCGWNLYLEHNWIETGMVWSLKSVSSMHRRGFGLLETTLNYRSVAEIS